MNYRNLRNKILKYLKKATHATIATGLLIYFRWFLQDEILKEQTETNM